MRTKALKPWRKIHNAQSNSNQLNFTYCKSTKKIVSLQENKKLCHVN